MEVAGREDGGGPLPPQAGPVLEEELDSSAPLLLADGARPPGSSIARAVAVRGSTSDMRRRREETHLCLAVGLEGKMHIVFA